MVGITSIMFQTFDIIIDSSLLCISSYRPVGELYLYYVTVAWLLPLLLLVFDISKY